MRMRFECFDRFGSAPPLLPRFSLPAPQRTSGSSSTAFVRRAEERTTHNRLVAAELITASSGSLFFLPISSHSSCVLQIQFIFRQTNRPNLLGPTLTRSQDYFAFFSSFISSHLSLHSSLRHHPPNSRLFGFFFRSVSVRPAFTFVTFIDSIASSLSLSLSFRPLSRSSIVICSVVVDSILITIIVDNLRLMFKPLWYIYFCNIPPLYLPNYLSLSLSHSITSGLVFLFIFFVLDGLFANIL
jgi:hypothetical protein